MTRDLPSATQPVDRAFHRVVMKIGNTLLAGLVLSSSLVLPAAAMAQHPVKHRKAKAIAAGVAAYEVAKHTGKPGRKNFMQRHPVLTGVAAGMAVNHHLKKKDKAHH